MELFRGIVFIISFLRSECFSLGFNYIKDPTFVDQTCPVDQLEFRTVTENIVDCVRRCTETTACRSLIYLNTNKTCYGVKSSTPSNSSTPLPGALFYKPDSTPMVIGLPDSQFSASSIYSPSYQPWQARFNNTGDTWEPDSRDTNQWLQVDFSQLIRATHLVTKGCLLFNDWTTSYKVLASTDCTNFVTIKDSLGNDKVFPGNTDADTAVQHKLVPPVICRCLRINPWTWTYWIKLRLEVFGHLI